MLTISLVAGALVAAKAQDQPSPPPPAEPAPQRVRVSSGVAAGLLIKKVNPKYLEEARAQRIQGVVVLRAVISKEG